MKRQILMLNAARREKNSAVNYKIGGSMEHFETALDLLKDPVEFVFQLVFICQVVSTSLKSKKPRKERG
ncbi:hypothetical protein [Salibacter halophilus]|uniref:Uncharacterized protein n=1 Tax=Salibacter halophilus TaxID=1803916 RepID=A0A6N6M9K8_9FLAO|nr:hypothetical protein [Salibacter halophilus]KAB1065685.1 hypothetical protein F3059_03245 [Salibacter halophilus]